MVGAGEDLQPTGAAALLVEGLVIDLGHRQRAGSHCDDVALMSVKVDTAPFTLSNNLQVK